MAVDKLMAKQIYGWTEQTELQIKPVPPNTHFKWLHKNKNEVSIILPKGPKIDRTIW